MSAPLSAQDLAELTALRRDLHMIPEVSGQEVATAARIAKELRALHPDQLITGIGGHGVAAVFGAGGGPKVLFRAELDGLPIQEQSDAEHRSRNAGRGHLCGHDGHMAMLLGLGRLVARARPDARPDARPEAGRVVLMFQPAEETGAGAAAVIADPAYGALAPDWAFAIHNMPRWRLGACQARAGVVNCASLGLRVALRGTEAHASLPETGRSPALALAALIPGLMALGSAGQGDAFKMVTITHAQLGAAAFGIAPGAGEVWATLRSMSDAGLARLQTAAVALAGQIAAQHDLGLSIEVSDHFAASVNDAAAVAVLRAALAALNMPLGEADLPMRASEDFGRFAAGGTRSAMLFLGAGEGAADLHNPGYDFPDAMLPIGISILEKVLHELIPPAP